MFSTSDTIVAIATPPGRGGLGVVRLSGPAAITIGLAVLNRRAPLVPRHVTLVRVEGLDHVLATRFDAPHSYTGDDVVEISAHGSQMVVQALVTRAQSRGARLAAPGEFTLRAFLNGKLDLVQAEAVADLIDAATPMQARAAFDQLDGTLTQAIAAIHGQLFDLIAKLEASLDFPDEGYHFIDAAEMISEIRCAERSIARLLADAAHGRLVRDGAQVVIAGKTNVGKSSLFNRLAGRARVIVTDVPGTTRDLVTERIDLDGLALTLVDTAGLRASSDVVEQEGVARAREAFRVATHLLVVLDGSAPLDEDDWEVLRVTESHPRTVVVNKADQQEAWDAAILGTRAVVRVSAARDIGIDHLRRELVRAVCGGELPHDAPAITNIRHVRLLEEARAGLLRARDAAQHEAVSEEFVLVDLQRAKELLEEVTGRRTTEDMLQHIFERFCIGK